MRIKVLGAAAGGGFPQWNCSCPNCQGIRLGTFKGKSRTQSQVAVSPDGERWILLNASPDLRTQIEATPALQPKSGKRNSPINTIVLSNADLDHVLGLLLLRELQQIRIYGTQSVQKILFEDNSMFGMLKRKTDQILWADIYPGQKINLAFVDGQDSGLLCEPFNLKSKFPKYVQDGPRKDLKENEAVLGLRISDVKRKKSFLFMPGVASVTEDLVDMMKASDLLFFDGTFWTEDELQKIDPGAKRAADMGHIPQSGSSGSLARLAVVTKSKKIFTHINNTNPILNEDSGAYRQVREAGWEVAYDGMEFTL